MREAYLTGGGAESPAPTPPAQDVHLTKVKVNRKDSTLYAEFTAQHHRPAHADLEACFARLLPHFMLLLEVLPGVQQGEEWLSEDSGRFRALLEDGELHQRPELQNHQVTGYAYSDKGGVVLLGRKTLRTGKVVNLLTPHEVLDPEQETGLEYPHLWQLGTELTACDKEVGLYLAGKSAPYVAEQQLELFDKLQDAVDQAGGYTSVTLSAGGQSATLTKKRGKDAAAGKDD